jgi:hypothetical protein
MKDLVKMMLIPIIGSVAIALIFILVVWAGNYEHKVVNQEGQYGSATKDVGGYAVLRPTPQCDDSYFPVCGFDGVTYDNACKAVANSTKVAHRGVCQNEQTP